MEPDKKSEQQDHLRVRVGQWFEASASGPWAIATIAGVFVAAVIMKLLGAW